MFNEKLGQDNSKLLEESRDLNVQNQVEELDCYPNFDLKSTTPWTPVKCS